MRNFFLFLAVTSLALLGAEEYAQRGAIFAQKVVDDMLAKHPDVIIMAMHVAKSEGADHAIVASNIGRIGKPADEDDMRVVNTGKPNLEVNKTGDHFEVEIPMRDMKGKVIGACGVVFMYKNGDNKQALRRRAEAIGKEMQALTPTREKLFEPWK